MRVDAEFGAGVGDVEVAHGELADAVKRGERGVFDFFHAQAFRLVGQVGRFGVQNRVIVATAQFEGYFAGNGFGDPTLGGFAQHEGLAVEPAVLVEQSAEAQAVDAVLFLNITPKIEEYLRKKIERVYSDEAKTGIFEEENPFFNHITDDLLETSVTLANLWKEEFSISENLKTNDLVFVQFSKEGVEHFAFL